MGCGPIFWDTWLYLRFMVVTDLHWDYLVGSTNKDGKRSKKYAHSLGMPSFSHRWLCFKSLPDLLLGGKLFSQTRTCMRRGMPSKCEQRERERYIYIYTCAHTCKYIYIDIYIYIYIHVYIYIHMYIYIYILFLHTWHIVNTYIHIYRHIYIYIYANICININIYLYICTYLLDLYAHI